MNIFEENELDRKNAKYHKMYEWGANGRKIVGQLKMKMSCFITRIMIPKGKKEETNGSEGDLGQLYIL